MYSRVHLMSAIVGTGLLVAVLHFFAIRLYLYWNFEWFDIVMHLLGGAFIGFLVSWAVFYFYNGSALKIKPAISFVMLSVLFIGIGWELFEAVTKTTGVIPGDSYISDTALDLIMDILGGAFAADQTFNRMYHHE